MMKSAPSLIAFAAVLLVMGGCAPESAPSRADAAGDTAPETGKSQAESCEPDDMCVGCDAAKDCIGSASDFCEEKGDQVTTRQRQIFCEDCHAKVRSQPADAGETFGYRWRVPGRDERAVVAATSGERSFPLLSAVSLGSRSSSGN